MPVASNFIFFKSLIFSYSISFLVTNFLGISHTSLISLFYFFINLIKLKPPSHSHQTANPVHRLRYLVCAWEREWQSCCFSDWRLLLLLHSRLLYQLLSLDCHSHRRNHCRESQAASETPQNNWRVLFLFFVVFVNQFSWTIAVIVPFFFPLDVICLFWALLFYVWIYWGHSLKLNCIIALLTFQKQTSTIVKFP